MTPHAATAAAARARRLLDGGSQVNPSRATTRKERAAPRVAHADAAMDPLSAPAPPPSQHSVNPECVCC